MITESLFLFIFCLSDASRKYAGDSQQRETENQVKRKQRNAMKGD